MIGVDPGWIFSTFHWKTGVSVFLTLLLPTATAMTRPCGLCLEIHHGKTGKSLASRPVCTGDTIRFSWIHSVELSPWHEYYEIEEGGGLL